MIVITTKKGRLNQPVRIGFNSSAQIVQKPDLFSIPQMTSADYIGVEEMLYDKGYFSSAVNKPYAALTPVADILYRRDNGLLTPGEASAQIDALRNHDIRNDYDKYFYRNGVNQQYALNLSGGNENISYIVAAGLDKNISNLNAGYDRLNLRAENIYKPLKNVQLTTGVAYTGSRAVNGRPGYNSILSDYRFVPIATETRCLYRKATGMNIQIPPVEVNY